MFFEKNVKRHSKLRLLILVVLVIALALLASVLVYASQIKQVEINNKGQIMVVKTMGNSVKDVLNENNIKIGSNDIVKPGLSTLLESTSTILIEEPTQTVTTQNTNVSENKVQQVETAMISDENERKEVQEKQKDEPQITQKIVVKKVKVPFDTEKKPNSRLKKGITKVVRQGKDGLTEKSYQIEYKDGKQVSSKLVKETIVSKPVNKIIEYGIDETVTTSRGDSIRFDRCFEMRATAYCASYEDTGKRPGDPEFGITAMGIKAKPGIVAVDPRVIPLGTRLYVESLQNGVPDYGMAYAADTGGAIKGNRIDLFFVTEREVDNYGVRPVRVYVLD